MTEASVSLIHLLNCYSPLQFCMYIRLAEKLEPLRKAESPPRTASLISGVFSRSSCPARLIAPALLAKSYTSGLLEQTVVITRHAARLTLLSSWLKIMHRISVKPPIRHRFRLLRGWSSTKSWHSSTRATNSSLVNSTNSLD